MKKVMLLVLASTLSLSLSSCYSSQLYIGGMEVDEPKRVFNSKTNNHFLFGLISPASNKKDIKQYVGDRQKYAIKNHHTFLNGFLEVITRGIYTPSKTTFYVPINE